MIRNLILSIIESSIENPKEISAFGACRLKILMILCASSRERLPLVAVTLKKIFLAALKSSEVVFACSRAAFAAFKTEFFPSRSL